MANILKYEGVTNIFTIAGDHTLPLMDTMSDLEFRFIDTRHEQSASFMADAWGRITGNLGVVMSTTPGMANSIPGMANALHSESPMLSISGSADFSELGKGANQEIDQVSLAKPVTKGAWMIPDANRIVDIMAMAIRTAYSGRRGPVHVTIPLDVQEQTVMMGRDDIYRPNPIHCQQYMKAGQEQIREAIGLLKGAIRPLIIAAAPAGYTGEGGWLQRFIEVTRIPLMTTDQARGLVSDDHPYCFGFFDTALNWAAKLVGKSDVILLLGKKMDNSISYGQIFADEAHIIQIDPSYMEIGRNRKVNIGMLGNIPSVVDQLTDEASKTSWKELPWIHELGAAKNNQEEWYESLAVPNTPLHATYVHKVLTSFLKPDDILVWDGGDFGHFGRMIHPARFPLSWFYFSQFGTLGNGLPTALAAKLAHPNSRVILITGDGGFGFTAIEFDTAVRHHLPIIAILGNDGTWGIDYHIQMGIYGRPTATKLRNTRYDRLASALGGHGEHVQEPNQLRPALERAFSLDKPSLLNVEIENAISPRAEASIRKWLERKNK